MNKHYLHRENTSYGFIPCKFPFCRRCVVYICRSCRVHLCELHKTVHETENTSDHQCEQWEIELTPEQITIILRNISMTVQRRSDLKNIIIEQTKETIWKIGEKCRAVLENIIIINNRLSKNAIIVDSNLYVDQIRQIQDIISSSIFLPYKEFEAIEKYYKFNNIYKISLTDLEDADAILSENHNLYFLEAHTSEIKCLSLTSDSKYIISCTEDTCVIWNLQSIAKEYSISQLDFYIDSMAITSDDTSIIFGCHDGNLRIWSLSSRTQESVLKGHTSAVLCLAASPDGTYIASGGDSTVRVWNLRHNRQESLFCGHHSSVISLAITSDSKYIVSGSSDRTMRMWSIQEPHTDPAILASTIVMTGAAVTSDGEYLVFFDTYRTNVTVWRFRKDIWQGSLSGHTAAVTGVAVSSDDRLIASSSEDWTVRVWEIREKREVKVLKGHEKSVTCVAITRDCKYVISGSRDRTVKIWNLEKGELECRLPGHCGAVRMVTKSKDSRHILSIGDDGTLRIWKLKEQKEIDVVEMKTGEIKSLAMGGNKYIVFGLFKNLVRVWKFREKY